MSIRNQKLSYLSNHQFDIKGAKKFSIKGDPTQFFLFSPSRFAKTSSREKYFVRNLKHHLRTMKSVYFETLRPSPRGKQ